MMSTVSPVSLNSVKKSLFHTPNPNSFATTSHLASDSAETILYKCQADQGLEQAFKKFDSVRHQQRLKKLKKELETLSQDDWKYPSVESLIGIK